jgi:Uncharacterized protein conserved in bacteria (DUF2062)
MFIGFTPLFGVKTLLSLGVAYLLRCNPIAAVIAVSLHHIHVGDVEMDDFLQRRAAASDRLAVPCCSGSFVLLLRAARDSEGPSFS